MTSKNEKVKAPKDAVTEKIPEAKPEKKASEKSGVFVYLGPSIRGVITNATICAGTRSEVLGQFADAIAAYPAVERLIVEASEVAAAKANIKAGGSLLAKAYADLDTKSSEIIGR